MGNLLERGPNYRKEDMINTLMSARSKSLRQLKRQLKGRKKQKFTFARLSLLSFVFISKY